MIIVDNALKERYKMGNPIQVGIIGAGYMGRGITLQIETAMKGMRTACVFNRTIEKAEQAFKQAEIDNYVKVESVDQLEEAIRKGKHAVTDNPFIICDAPGIDAIIEATGETEFGARVVLKAIENNKHVILVNVELDATVGPILKVYADKANTVITNADGDQPGVLMNLFRFVDQIGCQPLLAGNIKGMKDPYRTPETQKKFARKHGQETRMVTSFADGTKLSMEMAVVANATGFKAGRRGMYGPKCKHVSEAVNKFSLDELLNGGLVDYILGAEPGPGVFILGYNEHPIKKQYMNYFKMGEGPLYVFYTPYHLPHLEVPLTVARAVLFKDAAIVPKFGPICEVIATAKRDLFQGERLDGIGGYTCYGVLDNSEALSGENLLPIGLSDGCIVKNNIRKDHPISFNDINLPAGRRVDALYKEQNKLYSQDQRNK